MSYIKKIIGPQEKLLFTTHVHWIYLAMGLFWLSLFSAIGFFAEYYLFQYIGVKIFSFEIDWGWIYFNERHTPLPWVMVGVGLVISRPLFLSYISTEIGLTNERIIHKSGLIRIQTEQADLADISAEHVCHGALGWLLRYGRVHFDCRLVADINLPVISKPYLLIKISHEARRDHPGINYSKSDFQRHIEAWDGRKKEAYARAKFKKLAIKIKENFQRAS